MEAGQRLSSFSHIPGEDQEQDPGSSDITSNTERKMFSCVLSASALNVIRNECHEIPEDQESDETNIGILLCPL